MVYHSIKVYFFNRCENVVILIVNPDISNSVMEYFFPASGILLLAYAISLGFPSWCWYNTLPVAILLVSEYRINLPFLLGILRTGGFNILFFVLPKASCCSFSHGNGLPFLVRSYMGFSNFCNSGQNILTKLTIPAKLLQPFGVTVGFNFWIASNLLLKGFTHTCLFSVTQF